MAQRNSYFCCPDTTMARQLQIREALREAMSEEMRKDSNIILMGE